MSWEFTVISIIGVMTIAHMLLIRSYSCNLKQIEKDIDEMTSNNFENDAYLENAIIERVRLSARTKADRTSNQYVVIGNAICVGGLLIVFALNELDPVGAVEWMSLLLLPISGLLLFYNLQNKYARSIKWKRR